LRRFGVSIAPQPQTHFTNRTRGGNGEEGQALVSGRPATPGTSRLAAIAPSSATISRTPQGRGRARTAGTPLPLARRSLRADAEGRKAQGAGRRRDRRRGARPAPHLINRTQEGADHRTLPRVHPGLRQHETGGQDGLRVTASPPGLPADSGGQHEARPPVRRRPTLLFVHSVLCTPTPPPPALKHKHGSIS
jgi:hypothetical protein